MGDFLRDRLGAFGEAFLGFGLVSMPLWSHPLDTVVSGAHAIASITGAIIGIHAVWRIFRGLKQRNQRSGDSSS